MSVQLNRKRILSPVASKLSIISSTPTDCYRFRYFIRRIQGKRLCGCVQVMPVARRAGCRILAAGQLGALNADVTKGGISSSLVGD